MQNKLTSDYDDGGIKVWCNGKLIMHANHEQAKELICYLCHEWNIAPPNPRVHWTPRLLAWLKKLVNWGARQ